MEWKAGVKAGTAAVTSLDKSQHAGEDGGQKNQRGIESTDEV